MRIFATSVSSVYPHYVAKAEKKGRTPNGVDEVIRWLTGFSPSELRKHLDEVLRGTSSPAAVAVVADRGPEFDGIRIGRPATGALLDAGYRRLGDLPEDLDALRALHGVGPAALKRLAAAR